jgi:hypothetical protein
LPNKLLLFRDGPTATVSYKHVYVPHTGQTSTLQPYKVGVIILSLIVLVQTGLLVGALVKIVLLTKKGETFTNTIQTMSLFHHRIREEDKRREVGDGCQCGFS